MARRGGQNDLLHDGLGILGILLQIVAQRRGHRLIDGGRNLVVAQLGLGLALELRLLHLHRNHGRETLAEVVAVDVELQLREHARILGVLLERTGQRTAEARQVRAALDGVDVIYIGVYVLREGIVVLHGHLHRNAVLLGVEVDDLVDDRRAARGVEILHELLETLFRIEVVVDVFAVLVLAALVRQVQVYSLVQERQLAQTVGQNFVFVFGREREDAAVGLEGDGGAPVGALADDLDLRGGRALAVALAVNLAVAAVNLRDEQGRKRVHARYAHAVQTARNLVAALVELAAGMEHGQHHFERRFALLFVVVGRDAAAVVAYGDGIIFVDRHVDVGTVAGQRLVDRVVDYLIDQMVQTLLTNVADIHGGALAHRFEALKDLNIRRGIFFFLLFYVF